MRMNPLKFGAHQLKKLCIRITSMHQQHKRQWIWEDYLTVQTSSPRINTNGDVMTLHVALGPEKREQQKKQPNAVSSEKPCSHHAYESTFSLHLIVVEITQTLKI